MKKTAALALLTFSIHSHALQVFEGDQCPAAWQVATYEQANDHIESNGSCSSITGLGRWDVVRLAGGGSIDGPGYQCKTRTSDTRSLGHILCSDSAHIEYITDWVKHSEIINKRLAYNHPANGGNRLQYQEGVLQLGGNFWDRLVNMHVGQSSKMHGNRLFLPWHRGYVTALEKSIQAVLDDPNFSIPFWGYEAEWDEAQLPDSDQQLLRPLGNDLLGKKSSGEVSYRAHNGSRSLSNMLGLNSGYWKNYGGSYAQFSAKLESNPYNPVHGFVGGTMSSMSSPNDPIFYLHHGEIDYIWYCRQTGALSDQRCSGYSDGSYNFTDEDALALRRSFVMDGFGNLNTAKEREDLMSFPLVWRDSDGNLRDDGKLVFTFESYGMRLCPEGYNFQSDSNNNSGCMNNDFSVWVDSSTFNRRGRQFKVLTANYRGAEPLSNRALIDPNIDRLMMPQFTYLWTLNGKEIGTSSSIIASENGNYTLTLTAPNGDKVGTIFPVNNL